MIYTNLIESNKLLAEFMGYKYYPHPSSNPGWRKETGFPKCNGYFLARTHRDLAYHRSWDWIMPVVEKIESLGYCHQIHKVAWMTSDEHTAWITGSGKVWHGHSDKKIIAVYQSCIKFLEHYEIKNPQIVDKV